MLFRMVSVVLALLIAAPALAQGGADYTERLAAEIALKRAQVRAQMCNPGRRIIPETRYPLVGTFGPVGCWR